jgi:flagellum-specific ATP synthase
VSASAAPAPLLPENALGRLELLLAASLGDPSALVRRGGRITEVAASFYRVSGLEAQARLGDVVEHRGATGLHWGEISRVSQGQRDRVAL